MKIDYQFYSIIQNHCVLNNFGQRQSNSSRILTFLQNCFGLPAREKSNEAVPQSSGTFSIYAVEMHTPYSKRVLKKNFGDFIKIHKILHQLRESKMEMRDRQTGKLIKYVKLGEYLPVLPTGGRSFMSSLWNQQSRQNPKDLQKTLKLAQIKSELSVYCQQLLLLLDIFFLHNMKLKELSTLRKIEKYYRGSQKINTPSDHNKNIVLPVSGGYDSLKQQSATDPNGHIERSLTGSLLDDDFEEIKNEQAAAIPRESSGMTNSDPNSAAEQMPSPNSTEDFNNKTDIFNSSHIIEGEDIEKQHKIMNQSKKHR